MVARAGQTIKWIGEAFELLPQSADRFPPPDVIHHFQPDAIGIGKEDRVVIRQVFRPETRAFDCDSHRAQAAGDVIYGRTIRDSKTEMMQARRIGIVLRFSAARRPNRYLEIAIVVVAMGFTTDGESPFLEAERFHQAVVKNPRPLKIRDAKIDMINAENLRWRASAFHVSRRAGVEDDRDGAVVYEFYFHRGAEFAGFNFDVVFAHQREKIFVEAARVFGCGGSGE